MKSKKCLPLRKKLMYVYLIGFFITLNIIFGIFVWNPFDLSINLALLVVSLSYTFLIIYNWKKDEQELKKEGGKEE